MAEFSLYKDAITTPKSDVTDYVNGYASGLFLTNGGNVAVVLPSGTVVTFVGLPSNTVIPLKHRRVNATGTTAANLVSLFR